MSKPTTPNPLTSEQRQQLEADCTFKRIVELELVPVRGDFDAAHLKEVNRRIFQDLPTAGFIDVQPGEFPKPVLDGFDWIKQRGLSTVAGSFHVAYSRMDAGAINWLENVLATVKLGELRGLKTREFTARFANIYSELDYVHPFSDGNSRTVRTFTKQLAKSVGYEIDWQRFSQNDIGRDLLYIARDSSVNELAKLHVQHENTMRKILHTQDGLKGNKALVELLNDAVRPSRAVAFEQMPEREALAQYPELEEAYKTMHAAAARYALKMPDKIEAQEASLRSTISDVQLRLNAGETAKFSRG